MFTTFILFKAAFLLLLPLFIYAVIKRNTKLLLGIILLVIPAFAFLIRGGLFVFPFTKVLRAYCFDEGASQDIRVCTHNIVLNFRAHQEGGTQYCYDKWGWETGYVSAEGYKSGICNLL